MTSLSGQRILIVGAGSGIGRAIAERTAGLGAELVLAGRRQDALEITAASLPNGAKVVTADATNDDEVAHLIAEVGRLNHLISTVNAPAPGHVRDLDPDAIATAFASKLAVAILLAKHAADHLAPDGSMTLFSGYLGWKPSRNGVVQATGNGGVGHLAAALAVELAPIRVNAIAPGVVDNDVWDPLTPEERAEVFDGFRAESLTGDVIRLGDVVDASILLLTNRGINGTVLHIDGGARLG
jgi:NAD(P)-dependent dehydrogenase (short-subunit alcohol dehydrogenase family)